VPEKRIYYKGQMVYVARYKLMRQTGHCSWSAFQLKYQHLHYIHYAYLHAIWSL